jgi:hypothetical protein
MDRGTDLSINFLSSQSILGIQLDPHIDICIGYHTRYARPFVMVLHRMETTGPLISPKFMWQMWFGLLSSSSYVPRCLAISPFI